jgi:hypothetical protein
MTRIPSINAAASTEGALKGRAFLTPHHTHTINLEEKCALGLEGNHGERVVRPA